MFDWNYTTARTKIYKMINPNTACSLSRNLFVLCLVLNPKHTENRKKKS